MNKGDNIRSQKQHYVPQCYLRYFAYDNNKIQIFVYDKLRNKIFHTNIKNIANEKGFYDLIKSENKDVENNLESLFSKLETDYKTITDTTIEMIKNKRIITQKMKDSMSLFITFQLLRTANQREYIHELVDKMTKVTFEGTHDLSEEEKTLLQKLELDKEFVKLQHLDIMLDFDILNTAITALDNHIWIVGINNTSVPLFTSDHPVVKKAHKINKTHSYSALESEGIEVAFPITPEYIFILLERGFFKKFKNYDKKAVNLQIDEVKYYNELQAIQCKQHIFSSANKFNQIKKTIYNNKQINERIQVNKFPDKYGTWIQFKDQS